jgi:hypothetical protein
MKKISLLLPFLMVGCGVKDKIEDLKEELDSLTNRFVISTIYIGTEEFTDDRVDLSSIEEMRGTQVAVYLAEVTDIDNVDPVEGASIVVSTDGGTSADIQEESSGLYAGNQDDGLDYQENELVTVTADDGDTHSVSTIAPEAPEYDLPDEHGLGEELTIDISGQGFDSALTFVAYFGLDGVGELVYSNEPRSFKELYNFAYPDEANTEVSVTIPADAFEQEGLYVIGLGGVVGAEKDDMDNVNTIFSSLLATKMALDIVCVPTCIPQ